jgi:hypothetical protein
MRKNGGMINKSKILLICIGIVACCGCSEANKLGRKAVQGMITVNGQPLEKGSILFAPEDRNGVSSGAEIVDGTYAIAAHQGLTPGVYTVRIYVTDEAAEAVEPTLPGPGVKTQPELIPPAYNMRSELKLEVNESEDAVFDLDVVSKKR